MNSNPQAVRVRRLASAVLCLGAAASASADPPAGPSFGEQWRSIAAMQFAGRGRIAVADPDGDGRTDFIVAARSSASGNYALLVIGQTDDGVGIKQALILPDDSNVAIVRVLAATTGNALHVYTVTDGGTVRDFTGWPLGQVHAFGVGAGVTAAAIDHLLGDDTLELVVAAGDGLHAFDAPTAVPLWDYAVGNVGDLAVGQLDADAALEIILDTGLVIDGATRATDWLYPDPFGRPLATGHVLGDATTQFFGANYSSFTAFRGAPWSPLWSAGNSSYGIHALTAADLDGNHRDVIITGDAQYGDINAYDPITHQIRFSIPRAGGGIDALSTGDVDGDGFAELAIAPSQPSSFTFPGSTFTIVDTGSGATKWTYRPLDGTLSRVALGDVDGDGRDELVVAGNTTFTYGTVSIFDADTGALEWQSPRSIGNAGDPFYISTARILLVPKAQGAGMNIVLAGTSTYSGRITVVDGVTHAVALQIGGYASGPMNSRYLIDAALLDYDNDGTPDYAAATQPGPGGASGALLQVFSGIDGHTLWTSVPMSSDYGWINTVLVTGPATDPTSELIAVLPGSLRAYNVQTQLLDWTLLASSDGAIFVPHGATGAEIAVYLKSGAVTFYSAATHAYLRSFVLDAPLTALQAADGELGALVASAGSHLLLVDGHDGSVLASSDFLGENLGAGNVVAVADSALGVWQVAAGTDLALFRLRLQLSDRVFAATFESE